jgi:hypothetical protein
MPQPITVLNLFPTRDKRQSDDLPYNPGRAPKYWADPDALTSDEDMVIYERVLVGIKDGQPQWRRLFLAPYEAATYNIPPTGIGMTNVPGADKPPVPVPMRELADDEVIKPGFGNVPVVWKASEIATPDQASGFTGDDRALLKAIAAKLGA